MQKNTLIGIIACVVCVFASILISDLQGLGRFWDPPSVFIVVGGTLCASFAAVPFKTFKNIGSLIKTAFGPKEIDYQKNIDMIIDVANVARREGLLALEDAVSGIDSPFFKKGIMLVVDGADPELIKNIMEAEIYFVQERHAQGQGLLDTMAAFAPAFGMTGTLIGLINMLYKLEDTASLGPNMSVALVTTFYGTVLANALFTPLSKRLKGVTAAETKEKELLLEGLLSIQDGENPRIIREKLNAFIARSEVRGEEESAGAKAEAGEV